MLKAIVLAFTLIGISAHAAERDKASNPGKRTRSEPRVIAR